MRLRVNNGRSTWYDKETYIDPLVFKKPVIVAIDQSKTNTAIVIGSKDKEIYYIAECSGNDKEFYEVAGNTTEFCEELDSFLTKLLARGNLVGFWQEEPILKKPNWKKSKRSNGYDFYKSQMVLTEIRGCLLQTAVKLTGRPSTEVGNMDWKGGILPDGYRGHSEKGSYRFMCDVDPKWVNWTDDVTDALCIYLYAVKTCNSSQNIICTDIEKAEYDYSFSIVDQSAVPENALSFVASNKLSCRDNAVYFINRSSRIGSSKLNVDTLNLEDISKYAVNLYTMSDPYLLVCRNG